MSFSNWNQAVDSLTLALRPVTPEQFHLAKHANVRIAPTTPSIVASAVIRIALAETLHLPAASAIDDYRNTRIKALRKLAPNQISPQNLEEAKAWVDYLHMVLRRKSLTKLKLFAGDVVQLRDGAIAIVSSIGEDGRVYLRGGKGYSVWPDLLRKVLARADSNSKKSIAIRLRAENAAAEMTSSARWSGVRDRDLSQFAADRDVTPEEIRDLERVVRDAKDERPIQEFLNEKPHLLAAVLVGGSRFVIPQKRLGDKFIPDFVIGDVDSSGVRWILVELETPRSKIYLSDCNTLDKYARKGVDQITDWRHWLAANVAYAHRARRHEGLGLYDIKSNSEGLVLVGRRHALNRELTESKRRALREHNLIAVHTYDWLIEVLRSAVRHQGPPTMNQYLMHRRSEEDDNSDDL